MSKFWKIVGIGGILALVLVMGTTVALAQTGDDGETMDSGFFGRHFRDGGLLDKLAELLGWTREEVVDSLQDGKTPAELAEENGVDAETLIDELVKGARERITEGVNSPWQPRMRGRFDRAGFGMPFNMAEALGLTQTKLFEALQAGSTVAELAEEADVDLDALVDEWLADHAERLTEAVEAGRIDQETADEMLAQMETRIEEMLNGEWSGFGPRGSFGRPCDGMDGGFRGGSKNGARGGFDSSNGMRLQPPAVDSLSS